MSETILLLGSGSREHVLAWKFSQSPRVDKIFVAPGNGGIKNMGQKVDVVSELITIIFIFYALLFTI